MLFPSTAPLVSTIERNRSLWETSKILFKKYSENGMKGIDILLDPNFADEVLAIFAQEQLTNADHKVDTRQVK